MRSQPWISRGLVIVSVSLFAWGMGEGMFFIFQPIYLEKWGANPVEIGAILGAVGIAMAIVQAPAGYLADRIGARPIMWCAWILGMATAAMMALADSLPLFVAGMLTYGLTSFVTAPMNSYITSVRGRLSVERSLTIVMSLYFFGSVVGPILGGVIGETLGLKVVYQFVALIFLISTTIVLFARKPPSEEYGRLQSSQPNLVKNPRFIGLLALIPITMFALYLPQPLTPNFLQNTHHLGYQTIGQLSAMGNLGAAMLMLALGHLNASAGFLAGQFLVGIFALMMWRGQSFPSFLLGYFLLGGYRLARSMALAYSRSLVKPNEVGFAFGLVETGNAISVILAPIAAGFLYANNPASVYPVSLIIIGVVLLTNIFLLPKHNGSQQPVGQPGSTKGQTDVS